MIARLISLESTFSESAVDDDERICCLKILDRYFWRSLAADCAICFLFGGILGYHHTMGKFYKSNIPNKGPPREIGNWISLQIWKSDFDL